MAKLRRSHSSSSQSGSMIVRMGLFGAIVAALWFAFQKCGSYQMEPEGPVVEDVENLEETGIDSIFYLPTSTTGQVVRHKHYALSYHEKYEQAEWVAYELTRTRLNSEWVRRTNNFRPDPKVTTGSATPNDYRRTQFDRGHLAAAADMAFDEMAMSESFFMSNMSPQEPGFNKGIWRELEELNRDWAKRFRHLYVVTGPVLDGEVKFWLGENQVAVPGAFYRVILDLSEPELKGIAFVIPNEVTDERLENFATSIDAVEELTGINFFPELMDERTERRLESEYDPKLWSTNQRKYEVRVNTWNKQR